jgi:hypothetical protein
LDEQEVNITMEGWQNESKLQLPLGFGEKEEESPADIF